MVMQWLYANLWTPDTLWCCTGSFNSQHFCPSLSQVAWIHFSKVDPDAMQASFAYGNQPQQCHQCQCRCWLATSHTQLGYGWMEYMDRKLCFARYLTVRSRPILVWPILWICFCSKRNTKRVVVQMLYNIRYCGFGHIWDVLHTAYSLSHWHCHMNVMVWWYVSVVCVVGERGGGGCNGVCGSVQMDLLLWSWWCLQWLVR